MNAFFSGEIPRFYQCAEAVCDPKEVKTTGLEPLLAPMLCWPMLGGRAGGREVIFR